jgi:hypothetical protein
MGDRLVDSASGFVGSLNIKMLIFLFILFIIINSALFDRYVMSNFGDAVDSRGVTSYGLMIKSIMFILLYVVVNALSKSGIL